MHLQKIKHDHPRQKALAPPEAQVVPWFARLAAGRSTRVLWRGAERGQKGLFKRTTVSAEVAGASLSVALAPVSETQTGSERPNLARTGLVALM